MKTSFDGGPNTLKGLLVAPVNPALDALNVYPFPELLMLKLLNVPTPFTALPVVVPDNVPALGLFPIARAILSVPEVTILLLASRTVTWIAGLITDNATEFDGCALKLRFVAGPGATINGPTVAPDKPEEAAFKVYPSPVLSILRLLNVAMPALAAIAVVPDNVPPPGLVPIDIITLLVAVVTVFPLASLMITCREKAAPATAMRVGSEIQVLMAVQKLQIHYYHLLRVR